MRPLRILCIATKLPYPPVDGGRLLLWNTAQALAGLGHELTLVAPANGSSWEEVAPPGSPFVHVETLPVAPRSLLRSTVVGLMKGLPSSVVRHASREMAAAVRRLASSGAFDLCHVEQIHPLSHLWRREDSLPVVVRCQNAESELWSMLGRARPGWAPAVLWQARLMRQFESRCLRSADRALTLTRRDQECLSRVSGLPPHRLPVVPAPFASPLESHPEPFPGEPALLLSDSPWLPNKDGTNWFLNNVWPTVRRSLPKAVLHVFGDRTNDGRRGIVYHPGPLNSRAMFPSNGIAVVPLRIASGIRMKILEAWARGVPVVATPVACQGLEVTSGDGLLMASSPREFADAIIRLHSDSGLRRRLVEVGRGLMTQLYHPIGVARRLEEHYRATIVDHELATKDVNPKPASVVVPFAPGRAEAAAAADRRLEPSESHCSTETRHRTPT